MNPPYRLDGNRAYIPLNRAWTAPTDEETLMHWITAMLRPPYLHLEGWRSTDGPFGPRDTGYRWQLDASNNWWAEVRLVCNQSDPEEQTADELILACRYDYQPLEALATWVAAAAGPRP